MKPFDLEAAKRGESIVTRDGREVKFIAHVPEAEPDTQVIYLEGDKLWGARVDGSAIREVSHELFMAPKKRTLWVNMYEDGNARCYPEKAVADACRFKNRIGGKAYPLEIEE